MQKKLLMVLITHLKCVKCLVKNIFSLLLLYFILTHITKKPIKLRVGLSMNFKMRDKRQQ